jgi:hypothetical protein
MNFSADTGRAQPLAIFIRITGAYAAIAWVRLVPCLMHAGSMTISCRWHFKIDQFAVR